MPKRVWALAFCALVVSAQEYRGRIQGVISDTSQAVVVGATVNITNVSTGVRTTRQTNQSGAYVFDLIDSGRYNLSVELQGFRRYVQENISVESGGNVTVDAILSPGSTNESVTVTAAPVAVNFATSNVQLTIDTKLANDLPRFDRNPFKLTLLMPAAVNTRTEMNPFNSWAANSVELGGGTNLRNDLQIDGSPIGIGHKSGYTPPPDAVQEVNVQQNPVDAESGHSAGGSISVTMKSGTNDWHGTAWFLGRNPALNAVTDRTVNSMSAARNSMFGANLGNPIKRNKLFNYAVWEVWKQKNPINYLRTLPTDLQRQGDFSQTYNIEGGVKTIYDPFSTVLNSASGAVQRTPFSGNRIPTTRFDPVAAKLLPMFWKPNNPGDNITGVNNFKTVLSNKTDYWNFSDRVDYNISEKWRVSGRYSRLHTVQSSNDPTENQSPLYVTQNPSARHATSIVGDAVWTASPTTVVNFHGDFHNLVDDFYSARDVFELDKWPTLWGSNTWYNAYKRSDNLPSYFPGITIGGSGFGMSGTYWYQHPSGYTFNSKVSQVRGSHYWKAGVDYRHSGGTSLVTGSTNFTFQPALTADTFNAPVTRLVGQEYATFLLGAIDSGSVAIVKPVKRPRYDFWGFFFQDDWKLTRNLTVNLGLRYEVDTPWHDPEYQLSRGLDLTATNETMQRNPVTLPATVQQYRRTGIDYKGAWRFTDEENRYAWQRPWNNWHPRIGLAWRVNDKTSVRFGYSRFTVPAELIFIDAPYSGFEALNFLEPPYIGYDGTQNPQGLLVGVPQATLADPFPADRNPLIAPRGKGFGTALGLGGTNINWFNQNQTRPKNDRLSLSIQRQLPGQILLDVTAFVNYGSDLHYTRNINQADPRLSYTYKTALQASVPNPFYQYLTPAEFPGPSRNQANVSVGSLLTPYPQYGGLYVVGNNGFRERYQSLQFQARRPFANGFNLLFGYAYIRERSDGFFNDVDTFENNARLLESLNPRHRISSAGTLQLPFGKGRKFMSSSNRFVDAVFGGWQVVGALYLNSGQFLSFGGLEVSGDPRISDPTPKRWFDTSVFKQLPAFTLRTNPRSYGGLTGPSVWQVDSTLSKEFRVTERLRSELKMSAYNATNHLNRADPDTGVNSSTFGQTLRQRGNYFGRQVELGLKIMF